MLKSRIIMLPPKSTKEQEYSFWKKKINSSSKWQNLRTFLEGIWIICQGKKKKNQNPQTNPYISSWKSLHLKTVVTLPYALFAVPRVLKRLIQKNITHPAWKIRPSWNPLTEVTKNTYDNHTGLQTISSSLESNTKSN